LSRFSFDFEGWTYRRPPADPIAIAALSDASLVELPEAYVSLLRLSNGGGGPLSLEPGWFEFWPVQDVLPLNHGYGVREFAPGLFGFASNGGGELLAFDMRRGPPWRIVMVPFIGMKEADIIGIAADFSDFLMATRSEAPKT